MIFLSHARCMALAGAAVVCFCSVPAHTQTTPRSAPSAKEVRDAEAAYLDGAKALAENNAALAEDGFAKAFALNPAKAEYAQALDVARQHHVTALVQQAAKARLVRHTAEADRLFAQARALDPDNAIVTQHLTADGAAPAVKSPAPTIAAQETAAEERAHIGGAIHLDPSPATRSFHRRADAPTLLQEVYAAYGISTTLDSTVSGPPDVRLDLDDADFATATTILNKMTHVFAVPLQPKSALLAKDTFENRDRLEQKIEETIYLPALPAEQLNELSTMSKTIFDLKQVTVSPGAGTLLLRGSEEAIDLVDATLADLLDGGGEVMLDVHFYEVDKTHTRNLGASLPSSIGAFSIAAEAQQLVTANQSAISQAVASGLLTLNGTPLQNLIKEVGFLFAAGLIDTAQFSNFIGTFGGGLSFAGVFLGSGTSLNFLLNSSDARTIDDVQIRVGDRQTANFRSGSRYPITTATYSSGVSSSLASQLSGVKINGQSVASLLGSLGSSSAASVPQVQYEDLGLSLKTTPQILKSGQVSIHLDMKIESLGGSSINSIPILNSRVLTSDITVPEGQTALVTTVVSSSEAHSILGIPYLSEIPGFQGTDRLTEKDSGDLLITVTPHIVRRRSPLTTTRRLSANLTPEAQ